MSIASSLTAIAECKENIRQAIVAKGGTCPSTEPLTNYAAKITALSTGGGVFDLYKVTAYTPYSAAVPAQTGYTIALDPNDYSCSGTYAIQSGLESATGKGRRYACGSHYLVCVNTAEERWATDADDDSDCTWYLTTTNDPSCYMGNYDYNMPASDFPGGSWEQLYMEEITSQSTTAVQTSPATPEVQMVLTGAQATAYDTSTKTWTFSNTSTSLTGFEKTPIVDNIFACRTLKLIGNSIAYGGSLPIDQYTQMLICPKLADGSFSNLVTGSTASGTMTNVGVTLNSDNDMVFTSDSTRLLMSSANRCSGFFSDDTDWCLDQVMKANKDGQQIIHGKDGGYAPYPTLNNNGIEFGGCGVSSYDFSYATGDWLIVTTEHIASTHRTNWYVNGTLVRYMDNSTIYDHNDHTPDIAFWAYNSDSRWFKGAARCLRIRNNAPYQGTCFTSDLEFMKDL